MKETCYQITLILGSSDGYKESHNRMVD